MECELLAGTQIQIDLFVDKYFSETIGIDLKFKDNYPVNNQCSQAR